MAQTQRPTTANTEVCCPSYKICWESLLTFKNSVEVQELLHISRGLLWEFPHCRRHSNCTSSGLICILPCWLSSPGSPFTIPKYGISHEEALSFYPVGDCSCLGTSNVTQILSYVQFSVLSVAQLSRWKHSKAKSVRIGKFLVSSSPWRACR